MFASLASIKYMTNWQEFRHYVSYVPVKNSIRCRYRSSFRIPLSFTCNVSINFASSGSGGQMVEREEKE